LKYAEGGKLVEMNVGDNSDMFRQYTQVRGNFMKQMLTPEVIQSLQVLAKQDKNAAQKTLDNTFGEAANNAAKGSLLSEILSGKLKTK
jgi:hypothetical protein